jgi:lysophospholipase L1-like esterase
MKRVVKAAMCVLVVAAAMSWAQPAEQGGGQKAAPVDAPPAAFKKGVCVLFQGDSITDGARERSMAHLDHTLGKGYPYLIAANYGGHWPELDLKFLNRGVSGNKVSDLAARWQKDALDLKPDVVSILIGVNDVWHNMRAGREIRFDEIEATYDKLIVDTQKALPGVKIVLCEPFLLPGSACEGQYEKWLAAIRKIQAIVLRLGEKHSLPMVRYQKMFDEACKRAPAEYWLFDGVHPFYAGHQLMADEWVRVVKQAWPKG